MDPEATPIYELWQCAERRSGSGSSWMAVEDIVTTERQRARERDRQKANNVDEKFYTSQIIVRGAPKESPSISMQYNTQPLEVAALPAVVGDPVFWHRRAAISVDLPSLSAMFYACASIPFPPMDKSKTSSISLSHRWTHHLACVSD